MCSSECVNAEHVKKRKGQDELGLLCPLFDSACEPLVNHVDMGTLKARVWSHTFRHSSLR